MGRTGTERSEGFTPAQSCGTASERAAPRGVALDHRDAEGSRLDLRARAWYTASPRRFATRRLP